MNRKSVLRKSDRAPTRWVTLDSGPVIWTDASKATHFRVLVTESATLEPPLNAVSGQPFLWRLEWMATATVTLHSAFAVRGSVVLPTAAGSVYYLSGIYDEDGGVCDVLGTPDLSTVYDAAGTAAAAVAAHEAAGDPHPTYLTPTEGDAAYARLGADNTLADGVDFALGTTNGTKIGTDPAQKLGFYGAVPVVQGGAIADATDAPSAITQLNALLAYFRSRGDIAT